MPLLSPDPGLTQAESAALASPPPPAPRRPRRVGRIILVTLGLLVVGVALLVLLAPTLAGAFVAGRTFAVGSPAAGRPAPAVRVESASLSWFGSQRVNVTYLDDQGRSVAQAAATVDRGLTALLHSLDLGTVAVQGDANIVRRADGSLNVAPAPTASAPPPQPASAEPIRLPEGLKARLDLKVSSITFTDESRAGQAAGQVTVRDLNATADVDPAQPLVVKVTGNAAVGANAPGSVNADITVNNWAKPDGTVNFDAANPLASPAQVNAQIALRDVPSALLDTLAGKGGQLATGLGPALNADVAVQGGTQDATATLKAVAPGLDAGAQLRVADGVASLVAPAEFRVASGVVGAFLPPLPAPAGETRVGQAQIVAAPEARVRVQNLRLPLPKGGAVDLRGAAVQAAVELSPARASVVMQNGQAPQPVELQGVTLNVNSIDLAQVTEVQARGGATVNGQNAGTLAADLRLTGLADAQTGAPVAGIPAGVEGTITASNLATALLQPFVPADQKIDLVNDLGPEANVRVVARTVGPAPAGGVPTLDADVTVESAQARIAAAVRRSATEITTREQGITAEVRSAGQIAARYMPMPTDGTPPAFRLAPAGAVTLQAREVRLVMGANAQPDLLNSQGNVTVTLTNFRAIPSAGEPMSLDGLDANVSFGPQNPPGLTLGGRAIVDRKPVNIDGTVTLEGFRQAFAGEGGVAGTLARGPLGIAALAPRGKLTIAEIPAEVARLAQAPADPKAPAAAGTDLVGLIREAIGPVLNVELALAGGANGATAATVNAGGRNAQAGAEVVIDPAAREVRVTPRGDLTVSQNLLTTLGVLKQDGPRLAQPTRLVLASDAPLRVPVGAGWSKPLDLAKAGEMTVSVRPTSELVIAGVPVGPDAQGRARAPIAVTVRDAGATAKVPVGAAFGGGAGRATLEAQGLVIDEGGELARLTVSGGADVASVNNAPALNGAGGATARIAVRDLARIDSVLALDGLLTRALGASAEVKIDTTVSGKMPLAEVLQRAEVVTRLDAQAPRLKTEKPLAIALTPTAVEVREPWRATWTADPELVNPFLAPANLPDSAPEARRQNAIERLGQALGGNTPAPAARENPADRVLRMTRPATVNLVIDKLALARPGTEAGGMFKPGVFALQLKADVPELELADATGRGTIIRGVALTLNDLSGDGGGGAGGNAGGRTGAGGVAFDTRITAVEERGGNANPAAGGGNGAGQIRGTVTGLADGRGTPTPKSARLTAEGKLPVLPVALIDAFSLRNGLLGDILGPSVAMDVNAQNFGAEGGQIAFTARSTETGRAAGANGVASVVPRAELGIRGPVENGVLVTPVNVELRKIDVGLGQYVRTALPLVADFQKSFEQTPASVRSERLAVPLNGDLTALNGTIVIDPGEATFNAGGDLAGFLRKVGGKDSSTIGRRLQPLTLNIQSGVMRYERWAMPLGEFVVETEGEVNMGSRTLDIVTWVPFGALTDEAAGALNTGVGKLLGGLPVLETLTKIPVRTRGTFEQKKTEIDLELFAKNAVKSVNPKDLINNVGDLIKRIEDRKK